MTIEERTGSPRHDSAAIVVTDRWRYRTPSGSPEVSVGEAPVSARGVDMLAIAFAFASILDWADAKVSDAAASGWRGTVR